MKEAEKYLTPTWNKTYSIMLKLAEKIRGDGFKPDVIVGVARGGLIPARVLSDLLEQPNLATVRTECYIGTNQTKPEPVLSQQFSACVQGLMMLLVDDVADTGRSLKLTREHVLKSGAREVRIATLFRKPWSIVKPDYCTDETSQWVVFPWDIKETVRGAFENRGNTSVSDLAENLKAAGLPKPFIVRFLKEIAGENSPC
jgi:hypoxanthine phosphoribosyltransferase